MKATPGHSSKKKPNTDKRISEDKEISELVNSDEFIAEVMR